MLKKAVCSFLALVFLLICFPGQALLAAGPLIRIGLVQNQANVIISAAADFKLVAEPGGAVLGEYKANQKVALSVKNGGITVNGVLIANPCREVAVIAGEKANQTIEVNRRLYRGSVAIHRTTGKFGLTVVNTLPMEEYLYGVIPSEISPAWPLESLKAQAVAARTYALYNMNKYNNDGYDVNASTESQVYLGCGNEDARTTAAVKETSGLAMLYNGNPIAAFFHSSSGGYTESSENVWGNYEPYLRAVSDFDQKSPHYRWRKELKPQELEDALKAAGYDIGTLQAIELSLLGKRPMDTADRGLSGRVKAIRFIGSTGNVLVPGLKLRTILGLNSTLFDVRVVLPTDEYFDVDIVNAFGQIGTKRVSMNLPPFTENKLPTDKPEIRRLGGRPDEIVLFTGYGWGHGLGLSQWGAKAMAEAGPAGDAAYFQEILKHYYSGVDIQKVY